MDQNKKGSIIYFCLENMNDGITWMVKKSLWCKYIDFLKTF